MPTRNHLLADTDTAVVTDPSDFNSPNGRRGSVTLVVDYNGGSARWLVVV